MYGETLTKLGFDVNNNKFMEMCNDEYRYIGGELGEYECSRLLVEQNYFLENIDTLIMLIKMADISAFSLFYSDMFGLNLEGRLRSYGYNKSAAFMSYLQNKYSIDSITDIKYILDSIDDILLEYRKSIDVTVQG